ncbi:polyamine ABC transporter ATP-binding protein [Marinomonas sp. UCMA 3892]|uniref:Spermidine/putrescine import ATP-binding protein PotA n=1 Tax=Marinomonas polaris DSM 16579 TaxID=1122206 RepID=A0A1M5IQ05_9GAMM|nr:MULTISPECIES: ABC transporter ATP-binding protein [Marinomonas]NLU99884.1 polyamine ABC transporter ATP-binding protein [Marinomonas sp. UCMA 3892]PJE54308.1 ABC transporter ATP-binding protein [Marinomonas sp. BSi20584]SHG30030.1 putrescine transport system ATP-binding protein [Marinomonas polaris DSM 16579]|tara:strand:+ start:2711 stop:3865 length:1155 start_codon:yes stop_codon:yes gene_type:complete
MSAFPNTSTVQTQSVPTWRQKDAKPFVQIEQITKQFGQFTAVNSVSLDIYRNELFCLLGGSGSGKSTLLRMLAGFEEPTSGRILIDGVDMTGIPPWERPVNMMFQSYALFPHLSVEANVAFGLKREGLKSAEVNKRVAEILGMVQLGHLAKRKPHMLSGGQRQRVALARSLVKRPKLLLLDEPLGALDKKLREETQFELMRLQDELGITFIVVTHDQEEAMTLATRIGVMNNGDIVQTAEPHEVYEYPQNRFVAEFIGNVNLFDGTVIDDERDTTSMRSADIDGLLQVDHGISCAPNQDVSVAIRPEKIRISREPIDLEVNATTGVISDVAYMGSQSIFKVRLNSGKEIRITQPNVSREMGNRLTWEDRVFLSWDADSCVVLVA